jgi:SAM-dependent methyltransferase
MNVQVKPDHYSDGYDSLQRFCSYWTQIDEIMQVTRQNGSVLEIGKGTGLMAWYLQNAGLQVTTVDYDQELAPTVAADLRRLPFGDRTFNTVVAFQVLEHLPFDNFIPSLIELSRVARDHVIISLPNCSGTIALSASLPRLGLMKRIWSIPRARREVFVKGQHYWEIGVTNYSISRICDSIQSAGLTISKEYRLVEFPFHHFFILEKRGG